ncbi:hypothetical protein U771_31725 [Pseudomonas gorinensis]|jgi:hypothetical protein|uniref:Uncharacterized protein n=1 Tax=Pseudomonas gorinensis TaxID=3240790 RepID=A0ACA7PH25_9PSED|nr:hypothetical protein U771_31725 [Pseudomonas sp. TKP]
MARTSANTTVVVSVLLNIVIGLQLVFQGFDAFDRIP